MHIIKATGGDAKAAPDEETEDPIMKAEREFFEIIKKVRMLGNDLTVIHLKTEGS